MKYQLTLHGAEGDWWQMEFEAPNDNQAQYQADWTLDRAIKHGEIKAYEGYDLKNLTEDRTIGEAGQYGG